MKPPTRGPPLRVPAHKGPPCGGGVVGGFMYCALVNIHWIRNIERLSINTAKIIPRKKSSAASSATIHTFPLRKNGLEETPLGMKNTCLVKNSQTRKPIQISLNNRKIHANHNIYVVCSSTLRVPLPCPCGLKGKKIVCVYVCWQCMNGISFVPPVKT